MDRSSTSKFKDNGYTNDRERISQASSSSGYNDVADLVENMFVDHRSEDQKKLQEARVTSFLSGLPLIGGFVKGIDQARQLEDYYNNTGKLPTYPANSSIGYSGLGHSAGSAALSMIPDGQNDLYQFYSGEPDRTLYQ